MSDSECEEIFNIKLNRSEAQDKLASSAHSAEHTVKNNIETIEQVYEITLNIPSKYYTDFNMLDVYKTIWQKILKEYKVEKNHYVIEYCKSMQMHIHGYIYVQHPANRFYEIDESIRLNGLWTFIMKQIDQRLWRMNKNRYTYQKHYRKCFSPALCINCKEVLTSGWENYMQKNAPKNI